MSDKDNPFGAEPPSDPFGSGPPTDPFGRKPAPDDPFANVGAGDQGSLPQANPWRESTVPHEFDAPPPPPSNEPSRPKAEGAIAAMILGIVGIAFCPLCAPFAWYLGLKAERLVDASGGMLSGRGEATAGKILGIVACVLMILGVLLVIGLIAVGSSVETSSGTSETTTLQAF